MEITSGTGEAAPRVRLIVDDAKAVHPLTAGFLLSAPPEEEAGALPASEQLQAGQSLLSGNDTCSAGHTTISPRYR